MTTKNKKFPAFGLVALAAVAGLVAGVTALYVIERPDGNITGSFVTEASSCTAGQERAEKLNPMIRGEVAALLPAQSSQSFADLSFNGPDGQPMQISDLSQKLLLVNLWATWCVPCRTEMPALDSLQRELGSDQFEVVAINVDRGTDEKPKAFYAETGISSLAYYRDETLASFDTLKRRGLALGLPVTVLLDEKGCLVGHMNGPAEWDSQDAKNLIEAALTSAAPNNTTSAETTARKQGS